MSIAGLIVMFIITWWLVLFTTLPFGVRRDENPEPGNDAGAPVRARMLTKALVTTAIAATITAAVYFSAEAGLLPLREWLSADPSTQG
jgi:predicted secreted protein